MAFWAAAAKWAPAVLSAISLAQSKSSSDAARRQSDELASQGVRMRVADAKAAGLSPLAALGMPLAQPAAYPVGDPGYAQLGQDIGRAASATSTQQERSQRLRLISAQVTNQELQNDLLRTQIAKERAVGPALPSAMDNPDAVSLGQGDAVNILPARVTASERGQPAKEAGIISDYGFSRTPGGGLAVIPSTDVKNRIEDQIIPEAQWALRNLLLPSDASKPPRKYLPKGAVDWRYTLDRGWIPVMFNDRVRELSKPSGRVAPRSTYSRRYYK